VEFQVFSEFNSPSTLNQEVSLFTQPIVINGGTTAAVFMKKE
jgi:hypothetical protein